MDPEFRREAVEMLQKEGVYLGKEGRVWRKDGSIAHLLGAAVLLQDDETGEPYVQGVAVDITERKHAEEALQASEQRYRKTLRGEPRRRVSHQAGRDHSRLQQCDDADARV